jgi:phospholipase C
MSDRNGFDGTQRITRRRFLAGAAAGTAMAALGSACGPVATALQRPTDRLSPTTAAPSAATATPSPVPGSQIKRIVVFMKENHTFDNLFGRFPGANGVTLNDVCPDQMPSDMSHLHAAALAGATPEGHCQYTQATIPNYWAYASHYTLCDNFFTDVMGPSPANHLMFLAAQAPFVDYPPGWSGENGWTCPGACWNFPTILDRLTAKGLSWRNYWSFPWYDTSMIQHLIDSPYNVHYEQFLTDARAGKLADLSFVKTSQATSDHPPNSITYGEDYQVREINAIIEGGLWESTAIFITWDDWGGFYDHVKPPVVELWTDGTPFRYGPRVPLIVLGGYAKTGYIFHGLSSFVSITRFIERIYDLPPLTHRDATANDLFDCFDFTAPPTRPLVLKERPVHPRPVPSNAYVA